MLLRCYVLLTLIGTLPVLVWSKSVIKQLEIDFYSERISIEYPKSMILDGLLLVDELSLVQYFESLERTDYQMLLEQLTNYRQQYRLNDWLYFQLLKTATFQIFAREPLPKKEVSLWFLLTKSGFDTRLGYLEDQVFLYAWCEEDIFETPMIYDHDQKFINLSSINSEKKSPEQLKLLLYRPGRKNSRPFSFALQQLPLLPPQVEQRTISFKHQQRSYKINVDVDKTIFQILRDYPSLAELAYFQVPMSETTYNSLIPKLQFMVKDLSTREALQTLVAFTRSGFKYKDDQDVFGRSRPMVPEELLHYPHSDCEDRSALFYYLVQEILGLPMLIIAYPDHLTVAVAADLEEGWAIEYNGQQYFICDPTGPKESNIIGIPPTGYESTPFEILNF